jgi:hypothetical protein
MGILGGSGTVILTAGQSFTRVLGCGRAGPHPCRSVSGERCFAKGTCAYEHRSALLLPPRNSWDTEAKCSRHLCSRSSLGVDCCRMDRGANLGRDGRIAAASFGSGGKSSLFGIPPLPYVPEGFGSRYNVLHPLWDGFCSPGIEGDDESSTRAPNSSNFH